MTKAEREEKARMDGLVEAARDLAWWVHDSMSCPEEHELLQELFRKLDEYDEVSED